MSLFGFLGNIRIATLFEHSPVFWYKQKYMKECDLDLQMDILQPYLF